MVVLGGGGLIGRSVVKCLHAANKRVIVVEPRELVRDEANCLFDASIVSNLGSAGSEKELFERLRVESDCIEGWVNAAYPRTPKYGTYAFLDDDFDDGIAHFSLHAEVFYRACRVATKILSSGQGGSIVNFGSIYGPTGPDQRIYEGTAIRNSATYAMAKEAILGLTRYIATSFADRNIRCNAVCPGGVYDGHGEPFKSRYEARVPLNRMARPEEIANVVAFLVSEESSYMTGQTLMVDGGLSAW